MRTWSGRSFIHPSVCTYEDVCKSAEDLETVPLQILAVQEAYPLVLHPARQLAGGLVVGDVVARHLAEPAEQRRDVDGVQLAEPRVGRRVIDAEAVHAPAGGGPLLRPALRGLAKEVSGQALDLLVRCLAAAGAQEERG